MNPFMCVIQSSTLRARNFFGEKEVRVSAHLWETTFDISQ
jgi:hypothetical protein